MKRLLLVAVILLSAFCKTIYAEETCDNFYKINISIEGNGVLKVNDSDKSFSKDATYNVKCQDDFVFDITPDEGYLLSGVYMNGNYITKKEKLFHINNISSNIYLKIIISKEETKLENEMVFSSNEDNISLYIPDLKQDLAKDTIFKINLKEVSIVLDNKFIKNSKDNITLVANEIYKNDLNIKEQKAVKNGIYYDINLYNGEELIDEFNGLATVTIPYSKSKNVYVYRVLKDGKISLIDNDYKDGKVTFKVNKFGKFVLSKEELDELNYIRNIINLNNKQKISIIFLIFTISLLLVFIKFKKRK